MKYEDIDKLWKHQDTYKKFTAQDEYKTFHKYRYEIPMGDLIDAYVQHIGTRYDYNEDKESWDKIAKRLKQFLNTSVLHLPDDFDKEKNT